MILSILLVGISFGGIHIASRFKSYLTWQKFINNSDKKELLINVYDDLKYNADINKQLGDVYHSEENYWVALKYYNRAIRYSYDNEFVYSLGNCYEKLNLYSEAEEQYMKVTASIPNLLKPHYLLAKLYYTIGDEKSFNRKAHEILHFSPKTQNGEIFYMKEEIKILQKIGLK